MISKEILEERKKELTEMIKQISKQIEELSINRLKIIGALEENLSQQKQFPDPEETKDKK